MLRHFTRNALAILLFFIIASCSGGGCSSGCSSCGITPLPSGFPNASAVTNAASVRVTRPGLDFLQSNIGALAGKLLGGSGGVINFDVPTSMQSITELGFITINLTICPNGPSSTTNPPSCIADINIGGAMLTLDAITPSSIKISGTIPIKLQDLPITTSLGSLDIGVGTGDCSGPGGLPNMDYIAIPVDIELPLVADTIAPRVGYTKIDAANAVVNVTITSDDVQICNGGFLGDILDLFKSTIVSDFVAPLVSTLKNTIGSELCTKPDLTTTPSCPDGSQPNNADPTMATSCNYTSMPDTCMPILIGTDGHMNLGSLLSSISPGTTGGLDFLLASNGNMNPAPGVAEDSNGHTTNGMTLGFLGGTLPQPQTSCVPIAQNPLPTNIPIPMVMQQDTITPWPMGDNGPDLGVALAGRFLDFALVSVYNSGLLCLGVSTEQEQVLNSGLLSLLIPSINKLTWAAKPAAAAITTRPQAPPTLTLGGGTNVNTDPLLKVVLPKFAIDFYIWSDDRFVRAFTFTSDVTVPINLSTAVSATNPNGGIVINLGTLVIANGALTNNELITDDPTVVAGALASILAGFAGDLLGGGIAPINLSSALSSFGLAMTIPADGIKKISEGTDDYLAIFADLTLAAAAMPLVHTGVDITNLTVHPEAMALTTYDVTKAPTMTIALSSPTDDGTQAVEYSWWIDTMARSPWSTARVQTIDPQYMLLQGKHTLHAVARRVNQPGTEDLVPATATYIVDVLAPNVSVTYDETKGVTVDAWDIVSDESAMLGRYRLTNVQGIVGDWTEWMPLAQMLNPTTGESTSIDTQVKDEAGNVGSVTVALIRGRPDPTLGTTGSGCGSCSTLGSSPDAAHAWAASLAVLLGLVAFAARRRRGVPITARTSIVAIAAIGALAATNEGCSCGSSPSAAAPTTGCGSDCNQPCGPANNVGLIGSYTSVATATDGTIWVSGYNDGDVSDTHGSLLWGDLAVGKYDSGKQLVQWMDVDGLPPARTDGSCPPNDPTGWHGGETDLGPDVGKWSSIVLGADQNPMVSYYDATNNALKFAYYDGTNWSSYTVLSAMQSDIGRYSKLIMSNGNPSIAYLSMAPGKSGGVTSKVALATASTPLPKSATDWTFADVAVDPTDGPCAALFCDPGTVCIKETGLCQATVSGCTPAGCMAASSGIGSATMACVTIATKPTCGTVEDKTFVDDFPDGYGDYVSVANGPQGLGIILYDRIHGNLVGVQESGGKWTAAILDGETGSRTPGSGADGGISAVDTGDVGVGASLFITPSGDWHISYVNGYTEALQYAYLAMGKFPATGVDVKPEIVDTGLTLNGTAFTDGQHIVGDDSDVQVDANGVVTILYQDATSGTLRVAVGTPSMGAHKWAVKAEMQPSLFAGFFPRFVPTTALVSNWWRSNDSSGVTTGNVSLLTP
jgi:hypothetical protein